jgi:hypothetical protein
MDCEKQNQVVSGDPGARSQGKAKQSKTTTDYHTDTTLPGPMLRYEYFWWF